MGGEITALHVPIRARQVVVPKTRRGTHWEWLARVETRFPRSGSLPERRGSDKQVGGYRGTISGQRADNGRPPPPRAVRNQNKRSATVAHIRPRVWSIKETGEEVRGKKWTLSGPHTNREKRRMPPKETVVSEPKRASLRLGGGCMRWKGGREGVYACFSLFFLARKPCNLGMQQPAAADSTITSQQCTARKKAAPKAATASHHEMSREAKRARLGLSF